VHAKRMADATPSPLPAGSRLLQDLGFLAFTLPQGAIRMPTKQPRGQERTREQQQANQALPYRRLRLVHVNRSGQRCRIVKDRIRLWTEGVRDVVMDICWALHNVRVPYGQKTRPRLDSRGYDPVIAHPAACMLPTPSRILTAE
jgi:hypothetical protein